MHYVDCYLCGTTVCLEQELYRRRKEDRRSFDEKQAEVDRERRSREWAESRAKGANIAAGKAKAARQRLEHRVSCGVCPKCHRTFKQLAAHMASKHGAVGAPERRRRE